MFLGKLFPHATVQQEFSRKYDALINTATTAEFRTAASGRRQDGAVAAGGGGRSWADQIKHPPAEMLVSTSASASEAQRWVRPLTPGGRGTHTALHRHRTARLNRREVQWDVRSYIMYTHYGLIHHRIRSSAFFFDDMINNPGLISCLWPGLSLKFNMCKCDTDELRVICSRQIL